MFYFDTSFLAPLVIEEDTSELIEIFMTKVPIEQCVTSQFTLVEFANIAARRVRMREYSQTEANEAILLFE